MNTDSPQRVSRVAIIGGGLAGLAAATTLCSRAKVTLYEARSKPGGRAGAFVDAESGATLDLCQHVAMGCCTRLLAMLDTFLNADRNTTFDFLIDAADVPPQRNAELFCFEIPAGSFDSGF